ncbi:hypothetical protein C8J56DRAFT_749740, partial [Mycena floridula]
KLLEPKELSARLTKLCDENRFSDAQTMLTNSPLDAQNAAVWNTLIWQCMKGQQFQLAYKLYTDMKRRGIRPNIRTYQSMLSGYAKIEDWSRHPKQLKNVHALYDAYRSLRTPQPEGNDADAAENLTAPLTSYFTILGANGLQQKMFDIYYELDKTGPMAPNHFVFASMFRALCAKAGGSSIEKAASAKLLWAQMLKASQRNNFPVDSFIVAGAVTALANGRPVDQDLAFEIIHKYLGLGSPPSSGLFPLQPASFSAALTACHASKRRSDAIHFFDQVLERPEQRGGSSIIDRSHVESILQCYLALAPTTPTAARDGLMRLEWMLKEEITRRNNGVKLRPTESTFSLVLMICWQTHDWPSTTRTFELMTGYHAHDFMDGSVARVPRCDSRSNGRNLIPDAEALSCILRAAVGTNNKAHIRQALRICDHILSGAQSSNLDNLGRQGIKKQLFFIGKMADAILEAVPLVLSEKARIPAEAERWRNMAEEAR